MMEMPSLVKIRKIPILVTLIAPLLAPGAGVALLKLNIILF
jgi:hypothetical protein